MPASDINTYALSIEFGLTADKATGALGVVEQRLGKVEEQVGNLASKSLMSMKTITDQLNITLSEMAKQYDRISASNIAGLKPARESANLGEESGKKIADEGVMLRDKILKTWVDITKILGNKEKLLNDESKIIEKETTQMKEVNKELTGWADKVEHATKGLQAYLKGLLDIKSVILEAINATEKFVTANYRLYGSQSELVGRAYELSNQYGIMRGQALEAMKELGNTGVPDAMMNKLIETNVKFNRLSGASISATATWQKQMVSLGQASGDVEARMIHMSVAMRRFGLDANEVTAIMRTQEQQANGLRTSFGSKMTGEIQRGQVAMAAYMKEIGATTESINRISASMAKVDPDIFKQLGTAVGVSAVEMETAEGQTKAFALASEQVAAAIRSGVSPLNARRGLAMGLAQGEEQYAIALTEAAEQMVTQEKATGKAINSQKLMTEALAGHIGKVENLNEIYKESNNTIVAQLGLLKNAFYASIGAIWAKFEPAVIMFLKWINVFVQAVTGVVGKVTAWLDSLGPVGAVFKTVAAGVMVAVVAFLALLLVLNIFSVAASFAAGAGRAFGAMIEAALQGMARGLTAIAVHQITMLTLAALLISMGAGALMFALAVKILAQTGWAGVAALIGLTAVMVGFGYALLMVGTISTATQSGLYALSVAFIAIGASALMFALAVKIIAEQGWRGAAALIGLTIALVVMGVAIVALGAAAGAVAPGVALLTAAFYALAVVIVAVAVAALIFAVAVAIVAQYGRDGAIAVLTLTAAMVIMMVTLVILAVKATAFIGPIIVLVAVFLILAVAALIVAVAIGIVGLSIMAAGLGARMFAEAVKMIAEAGSMGIVALAGLVGAVVAVIYTLAAVAVTIAPILPLLYMLGLALMMFGAAAMFVGVAVYLFSLGVKNLGDFGFSAAMGIIFITGAIVILLMTMAGLAPVAAALLPIMIPLALVLLAIGVAALLVGVAALLVAKAIQMIAQEGLTGIVVLAALTIAFVIFIAALVAGALAALPVVPVIYAIAVAMIAMGAGMLLAGVGAYLFGLGLGLIVDAAAKLTMGMAIRLSLFAVSLAATGLILAAAAQPIMIAAVLLVVAGALFAIAMLLILSAAESTGEAGKLIGQGGPELMAGSAALLVAGIFMMVGSVFLLIGGGLLIAAAATVLTAGVMLRVMTGPIVTASEKLLPAAQRFMVIGAGFLAGGQGLMSGAAMMRASVSELRAAGKELGGVAGELMTSLEPMLEVAALARQIAYPIMLLGYAVKSGAAALLSGAITLKVATAMLRGPVDELYDEARWLGVAATWINQAGIEMYNGALMMRMASYLLVRAAADFWALVDIADIVLIGSARLSRAASALISPAFLMTYALMMMTNAAFQFSTAMSGLRQSMMEPLGAMITLFATDASAAAIELFDALDSILSRLESYADKMTANSSAIAKAFRDILPTMPIGSIGLNLISSQSFTTTRGKDSADTFFERGEKADARRLQERTNEKLDHVVTGINALIVAVNGVTGGAGGVGNIKPVIENIEQLLRDNLPNMARAQNSGLSHALNEWMR